jgi:hypothetical protein
MFHCDFAILHRLADIVGKIALEVALAQPGKDLGLLPVNCLLNELQEVADKLPPEMAFAIGRELAVVDKVFETSSGFDPDSIKQLTNWANWMNWLCCWIRKIIASCWSMNCSANRRP